MSSQIIPVEPFDYVVFGGTGDLAERKLLPALFHRQLAGQLTEPTRIIGASRTAMTHEEYRKFTLDALHEHLKAEELEESEVAKFLARVFYVSVDAKSDQGWEDLKKLLDQGKEIVRAFYLAVSPSIFGDIADKIRDHKLITKSTRIVVEKPIGRDLASAQILNDTIGKVFKEDQIFRIDHYLGKETVQNILALRFANAMYEPIWNRNYVDHVQITMAEDIGVGGRAGYYDGVGAARDVIQNHLLQLLALTAMEQPISLGAQHLRAEKEKVLEAVSLPEDLERSTARGQYASGWQGGELVNGFLDEDGMNPQSRTETFAAMKLHVNTRRWTGVPFYLRTGKRLGRRVTEIAVVFRKEPGNLFGQAQRSEQGSNALVIRVQPDEGITIRFGAKVPGSGTRVRDVTMDFGYGHAFTEASPEAYERLILDVLLGDAPLFPRQAEVELSWRILDPIERHWAESDAPVEQYVPGSWGPASADEMLARDGRTWRRP